MVGDRSKPFGGHYEEPPLPPVGFDPLQADDNTLEGYWLPARPDPKLHPDLYEHWSEMMSPAPTFVSSQSEEPPHAEAGTTTSSSVKERIRSRIQNSRNWSGAYVSAHHANRFTRVVGRWTVPSVKPGVRAEDESPTMAFQCSIWIGLDGKKRWTKTMPQVGSVHTIQDDGKPASHDLWWQWWKRDTKVQTDSLPWKIKGVPISPGDLILCSLSVTKPKTVRLHVINRTTGAFATVQLTRDNVLGSTAEWIVERPANWLSFSPSSNSGPLFPLPDYGEVVVDRCATEHALPPAAPTFLPRLIRMKQKFLQFNRVAVISAPSTRHEPPGRVRMTYRRP
jgi:hypothetical protein